jgi:hypothetical protein
MNRMFFAEIYTVYKTLLKLTVEYNFLAQLTSETSLKDLSWRSTLKKMCKLGIRYLHQCRELASLASNGCLHCTQPRTHQSSWMHAWTSELFPKTNATELHSQKISNTPCMSNVLLHDAIHLHADSYRNPPTLENLKTLTEVLLKHLTPLRL